MKTIYQAYIVSLPRAQTFGLKTKTVESLDSSYFILFHCLIVLLHLHHYCLAPFDTAIGIDSSLHISSASDVMPAWFPRLGISERMR